MGNSPVTGEFPTQRTNNTENIFICQCPQRWFILIISFENQLENFSSKLEISLAKMSSINIMRHRTTDCVYHENE